MEPYFTVVIPWVPYEYRTTFHPVFEDAPPLTRGRFSTWTDALVWAKEKLDGTPYQIKVVVP